MHTSVKQIRVLLMTFALIASSFVFGGKSAGAQTRTLTNVPGKWASAILIQNIGTADLTSGQYKIDFYDSAGSVISFSPTTTIEKGKSREFYIPNQFSSLASGQYSAVISSQQKVKAVVNSSTDSGTAGPWSAFSYEGVASEDTSTKLYFPAFYRNYYTFLSELVVQNAGSSTASLQATFYNGITGANAGTITLPTIPINSSRTFSWNDSLFSGLVSGSQGIYGVVVESTNGQALAGISNIWSSNTGNYGVASYNAFTAGSTTAYIGALYNQFYGFVSSITVQNIGTAATDVTITYSDGLTDTFNIPQNQSRERFQPGNGALTQGLLSAKVTSTSSNIVVLVNIQRKLRGSTSVADPVNPALGSYTATAVTATSVNVPAIFYNYYGYFTAVTVKNVGTLAADITLTYADGSIWKMTNVGVGATVNFTHLPGESANHKLASGTQTAGTVSSTQPLAVVIQHNTDASLSSYRASKAPNDFLFVLSGFPNI